MLNKNAVTIHTAGLDALAHNELVYHSYAVIAGTPDMTMSTCKCTIVLLMQWYMELAEHFPDGIEIKNFYNRFLATVMAAHQNTPKPALAIILNFFHPSDFFFRILKCVLHNYLFAS